MMKILGVMAAAVAAWLLGGWVLCSVVCGFLAVVDVMDDDDDDNVPYAELEDEL